LKIILFEFSKISSNQMSQQQASVTSNNNSSLAENSPVQNSPSPHSADDFVPMSPQERKKQDQIA